MDVEALLMKMREEQREDHQNLVTKVDEGFASVRDMANRHALDDVQNFNRLDSRVLVVENTRRTIRWLTGTIIVALVGGVADALFNHFTK